MSMSAFINNGVLKMKIEAVLAKDWNAATKKCCRTCYFKDHRGSYHSDLSCNDVFNITWPFPQEKKTKSLDMVSVQ